MPICEKLTIYYSVERSEESAYQQTDEELEFELRQLLGRIEQSIGDTWSESKFSSQ